MSKDIKGRKRRPVIFLASSTEAKDIMKKVACYIEEAGGEAKQWPKAFPPGEYSLESLLKASQEVDGALIVGTPDDKSIIRKKTYWTLRDNVLLELGIFLSALTPERAALIDVSSEQFESQLPSDLYGWNTMSYKISTPAINERDIKDWMKRFFIEEDRQQSPLGTPKDGIYTWEHVGDGLEHIQRAMESDQYVPDMILGLGRSGGVVGGVLASFLDSMPFNILDLKYLKEKSKVAVKFNDANLVFPKSVKRVLVIEGATTAGQTLIGAEKLLEEHFPKIKFTFAVLILTETSQFVGCSYYSFLQSGIIKSLPWHGPRSKTFLSPNKL